MPLFATTIRSPLPIDEFEAKLRSSIRVEVSALRIFDASWNGDIDAIKGVFYGRVEGRTFVLQRVINYRNSFLPVIRGEFAPDAGGTRVEIFMHLNVWHLMFALVFAALGARSIFVALFVLLFVLLASAIPFFIEARLALKTFERELQAR